MRALTGSLLSLSLFLGACATSSQGPSLAERRDAIRQANVERQANFEKNYRGQEGFQSTRWSMSSNEVRALYPGVQQVSPMILAVNTEVVEHPAVVYFYFTQDRLALVSVEFSQPNDVRASHEELVSLLMSKYGPPSSNEDSTSRAGYVRSADEIKAQLNYDLRTVWTTHETRIQLIGHRTPDQKVLDLQYESTVLGVQVLKELAEETARHQRNQLKDL